MSPADSSSSRTALSAGRSGSRSGSRPQPGPPPHSGRFTAATSTLVAIAIIALAGAYVVWHNDRHHHRSTGQWSAWRPLDSGVSGAVDIANHVAPAYRISATQQLNAITLLNVANPDTIENSTTGTPPNQYEIAVGNQSHTGSTTAGVQLITGRTIAYNLCGLGTGCGIGAQIPSNERELLLRREGLELALYTFRYLKHVKYVSILFPPATIDENANNTNNNTVPKSTKPAGKTEPLDLAMMFTRGDLEPFTSQRGLSRTLSSVTPIVPLLNQWTHSAEASLVEQITAERLFTRQIETLPDGSSLLVLNPTPSQ